MQRVDIGIPRFWGIAPGLPHFPSVAFGYYPGSRASRKVKEMAFRQGWGAACLEHLHRHTSIQPSTLPGTPFHPDGQRWEASGGDECRGDDIWERPRQGNLLWWRGESFPFLASPPAASSPRPLSAPLHSASASGVTHPGTCPRRPPHSSSPRQELCPFTSSGGELKQRLISLKGNR